MADQDVGLPVTFFRSEHDQTVRKEFDAHNAALAGFLSEQHHDNGTHGDITADSIQVISNDEFVSFYRKEANGNLVLLGQITQEQIATGHVLVLDAGTSVEFAVKVHEDDAMRFGVHAASDVSTAYEQQAADALSVLKRLKFAGQSSASADPPGTDVADDDAAGPLYSVYALTSSGNRTVSGFTTSNTTEGARGQLLITWNDSASNVLTFTHDATATSFRRLLCPYGVDLKIGPKGTAIWLYDIVALRWKCIAFSGHISGAYTPTWTSDGTPPAIVNGTITGLYQRDGSRVSFSLKQVIGSSDTFGTGNYRWSIPVTMITTEPIPVLAVDATGPTYFVGMGLMVDGTHLAVFSTDPAGATTPWGATVPFTWANGDAIVFSGAYFV